MTLRHIIPAALSAMLLVACGSDQTDQTSDPVAEAPPAQPSDDITFTPTETAPQTAKPITAKGYGEGWDLVPFWSGEYPNAFSVTRAGLSVPAHSEIQRDAPADVTCPLPHKATYSPWNASRFTADQLEFVTMTFPTKITINDPVTLQTFEDNTPIELTLSAGDTLTYKTYLAEGYFIGEYEGQEYELGEMDLPDSTEFEVGPPEEEWVRVTCADANKTRAWLRFDSVIEVEGITRYNYTGYGEASDLP